MTVTARAVPPRDRGATWEDFVLTEEDDLRELIDGELVEADLPTDLHERVVAMLIVFLGSWARARGAGWVHASGYKVRVSSRRGFMPDVQFYRIDNPAKRLAQGLEEGRPDLVIEVISPTSARFDRVTKLTGYASLGVPEYWIVDPEARTLERLVLAGEHYAVREALEGDGTFSPEAFDGLEIPLGELWMAGPGEPSA